MRIFYKYAGPNGLGILDDLRLKVTPPNEFNDPFEVTPRSNTPITQETLLARIGSDNGYVLTIYNLYRNDGGNDSFEEFSARLPHEIQKQSDAICAALRDGEQKSDLLFLAEASEHVGVLCLSQPEDDVLLWSHYADHHRGISIGVDLDDDVFRTIRHVENAVVYENKRYPFDRQINPETPEGLHHLTQMLFHKSDAWCHEREYRLAFSLSDLEHKGGVYLLRIYPSTIREVVLGCRINRETEERLLRLLALKRFSHIRVRRAVRHREEFALDLEPVVGIQPSF